MLQDLQKREKFEEPVAKVGGLESELAEAVVQEEDKLLEKENPVAMPMRADLESSITKMYDLSDKSNSQFKSYHDDLKTIPCRGIMTSVEPKKRNMYTTKSFKTKHINLGAQLSTDNAKTNDYDAILHSEIGDNTIKSQKKYCKNIVNDSNARFIDTEIETIYV